MSMMADMQATQTLGRAEHRTKGSDVHAASLKNHRRFVQFSVYPDAVGGTGTTGEQENQSLSQQMENCEQHYRKVEKQDIPAVRLAFEKQWQQWGASDYLQLSESSLLKREVRRKRLEGYRAWSRSDEPNSSGK